MPDKVDLKRTLDAYAAKKGEIRLVDVPPTRYLMVDGRGDPNTSPDFAAAVEALYPVAYKTKFASKRELGRDYVVMPLEGLWTADDPASFTTRRDKSAWAWTLMIMTPDWVDDALVERAREAAGAKDAPARLADVRLETLAEGRCVQTLHVGSFDDEGPVLARIHDEFIPAHGLRMTGRHHEIYLSDFRKVPPERLRTILRQPVAPA
ncbi:GyrI-like domain-containing protein [Demequina rhizosphaerae]|uniref:GyrI-like domain-containing protein n=1 Tax=Demequina rhizosphaerae TaxID=1638985 RepID=UPI000783827E|nr:GyrI-like domain-containing protein [Demequina rhizosphaerae]